MLSYFYKLLKCQDTNLAEIYKDSLGSLDVA